MIYSQKQAMKRTNMSKLEIAKMKKLRDCKATAWMVCSMMK